MTLPRPSTEVLAATGAAGSVAGHASGESADGRGPRSALLQPRRFFDETGRRLPIWDEKNAKPADKDAERDREADPDGPADNQQPKHASDRNQDPPTQREPDSNDADGRQSGEPDESPLLPALPGGTIFWPDNTAAAMPATGYPYASDAAAPPLSTSYLGRLYSVPGAGLSSNMTAGRLPTTGLGASPLASPLTAGPLAGPLASGQLMYGPAQTRRGPGARAGSRGTGQAAPGAAQGLPGSSAAGPALCAARIGDDAGGARTAGYRSGNRHGHGYGYGYRHAVQPTVPGGEFAHHGGCAFLRRPVIITHHGRLIPH